MIKIFKIAIIGLSVLFHAQFVCANAQTDLEIIHTEMITAQGVFETKAMNGLVSRSGELFKSLAVNYTRNAALQCITFDVYSYFLDSKIVENEEKKGIAASTTSYFAVDAFQARIIPIFKKNDIGLKQSNILIDICEKEIRKKFELEKNKNIDTKQHEGKSSLEELKTKANLGDNEAQFSLGFAYEYGLDVRKDYRAAARWYLKSAINGNAMAQFHLCLCYHLGRGVQRDDSMSAKWCRRAAEQGHLEAQSSLGWLYHQGEGVSRDYQEAVSWFKRAADRGHAGAQGFLGESYELGQGVPQDYSEAVKWYRRSAEQGESKSQYKLGYCYATGNGLPQDASEAYVWFSLSAANGEVKAPKARDQVALMLSPQSISRAQTRVKLLKVELKCNK